MSSGEKNPKAQAACLRSPDEREEPYPPKKITEIQDEIWIRRRSEIRSHC